MIRLLAVVALSSSCVFLRAEPVPCAGDGDCPTSLFCTKGACSSTKPPPSGPQPIVRDTFDGADGWDAWDCDASGGSAVVSQGAGHLVADAGHRADCRLAADGHDVDMRLDLTVIGWAPALSQMIFLAPRLNDDGVDNLNVDRFDEIGLGIIATQDTLATEYLFDLVNDGRGNAQDANTGTIPGSDLPGQFDDSIGNSFRVRVEGAAPTRVRAKEWRLHDPEPSAWDIDNGLQAPDDDPFRDGDVIDLGVANEGNASLTAVFDDVVAFHAADVSADEPLP